MRRSMAARSRTPALATPVSGVVPGDYTVDYIDLQNLGSVTQTFTGRLPAPVSWPVRVGSPSRSTAAPLAGIKATVPAATAERDVAAVDGLVSDTPSLDFGQIDALSTQHLRVTITAPGADPSGRGVGAIGRTPR